MNIFSSDYVTIENTLFEGNTNGAVFIDNKQPLSNYIWFWNSSFVGNRAETGAAIKFGYDVNFVSVAFSRFADNVATAGSGGAIYISSTSHHINIGGAMPAEVYDDSCGYFSTYHKAWTFAPDVPYGVFTDTYYVIWASETTIWSCESFGQVGDFAFGKDIRSGKDYDPNCANGKNGKTFDNGKNGPYKLSGLDTDPAVYRGRNIDVLLCPVNTEAKFKVWIFPNAVPVESASSTAKFVSAGLTFIGNNASVSGGAVYIDTDPYNNAHHIVFHRGIEYRRNFAGVGGAVCINKSAEHVYMYSTVFVGNRASLYGGALAIMQYGLFVGCYGACQFVGNTAGRGGGLYLGVGVAFTCYDCEFKRNVAQYGAGAYLSTMNGNTMLTLMTSIRFEGGVWEGNRASIDGGGLYADTQNGVTFNSVRWTDNYATNGGGGLYINNRENVVVISDCIFTDNRAGVYGGAVFANFQNSITFGTLGAPTSFTHNTAGRAGGAVYSQSGNTLTALGDVTFNQNSCFDPTSTALQFCAGGALAVYQSNVALLGTTRFLLNTATHGGALHMAASVLTLGSKEVTLTSNSALSGSAMYMASSSSSLVTITT